ncbi:hypothetical protein [Bradyrhizobium sp. CCGUVB23]|uniref:DUF7007 domain-containing protein n=1 Tax=Bradyrhizobium sp. CCGUVB23 TaxID=2949630 RepID=UPI0020B43256|nr:hypothetical protein [Bradyrhizobium sp. CCGUVB23]MCP3468142.1 hypothetical protein [Bradyrhizobium sp. CCGUVB23]
MNAPSPASDDVAFGRSPDGLLVALVGETAFAMVPAGDGRHFLATGWRINRPMGEWTRGDFYGHSGELADEAAFRNAVLENAEHQRERRLLGRIEQYSRAHTPWGLSQGSTVYAEGVASHSTAGHGGFKLSAERNRFVHHMLRSKGGWYEEDAEWAIVAITFPDLFTAFERRCAEKTIKDRWPDAWEAIFGTILQPGESREKDRRGFEQAHARDWIVVSAITSKHASGFVETVATLGAKRGPGTEERRFLVPSNEYHVGRFGFVIDEARHQLYGGPSDFVGWR